MPKKSNNRTVDNISKNLNVEEIVKTNVFKVTYCDQCGSPVVDHPEAIYAHHQRVHTVSAGKRKH